MPTEHATNKTTLENHNIYQKSKELLCYKNQIIFYGPPGTGKTYHARKLAEELTMSNREQKNGDEPIDSCEDKWFEYLKSKFKPLDKRYSPQEPHKRNFKKNSMLALKSTTPDNEKRIAISYLNRKKPRESKVSPALARKKNEWLQEVPEEDRFYLIVNTSTSAYVLLPWEVIMRYADTRTDRFWFDMEITENSAVLNPSNKDKRHDCTKFLYNLDSIFNSDIQFVTFHPSYSYEEFIEGIKTKLVGNNIEYYINDGVFKKLCKDAEKNEKSNILIIIDEINRGNISKILGEMITNIEKDKRGDLWTTLAYSKERFTVPKNVLIIGTMNTADRSLTQIDVALRRRFAFVELLPDSSLVDKEINGVNVGALLKALNSNLIKNGFKEKQFGHSYFMKGNDPISSIKELRLVFENEIIPMLQDYFYEDYDGIKDIISDKFIDKNEMSIKTLDNDDDFIDALKETIQKEEDVKN